MKITLVAREPIAMKMFFPVRRVPHRWQQALLLLVSSVMASTTWAQSPPEVGLLPINVEIEDLRPEGPGFFITAGYVMHDGRLHLQEAAA